MIEFTKAFKTSDGKTYATIEDAQKAELGKLLNIDGTAVLDAMIEHRGAVLDILSTTAKSKPRARKINGGTKIRKPKLTTDSPTS